MKRAFRWASWEILHTGPLMVQNKQKKLFNPLLMASCKNLRFAGPSTYFEYRKQTHHLPPGANTVECKQQMNSILMIMGIFVYFSYLSTTVCCCLDYLLTLILAVSLLCTNLPKACKPHEWIQNTIFFLNMQIFLPILLPRFSCVLFAPQQKSAEYR